MSKTYASLVRVLGGFTVAWLVFNPALANGHGGFQGGFHGGGGMHAGAGGQHSFSGPHSFSGGHGGFAGGPRGFAAPHYGATHFAAPRPMTAGFAAAHYAHSYAPRVNGGYGHRPGWGGGYWHGRFWPGAYYRPGFAWFLPVLPGGYLTLWWSGLPYYSWDDAYYLWSPQRAGYVITDPPPVNESAADANDDAPATGGSPELYVYPRKGQSDAQTASDRFECHQWAVGQSGFDPSRATNPSGSTESNYHRAITACLDARGYSAQ